MTSERKTLELTVPDLCCAAEAQEIEAVLTRLEGVTEVRAAVTARKAIVSYDPRRVAPAAIHREVSRLGMRVVGPGSPAGRRLHRLPDLVGWAFGVLLAAIGWLPPIAAAAAQSVPDVAVMLNAARLLRER